jgi:hypothetical protein
MITCSCGKTIEKVPTWLQSVKVDFVCNNCPNRQTKNIAFISLEPETPKATLEDAEEEVIEEEAETEAEPAD